MRFPSDDRARCGRRHSSAGRCSLELLPDPIQQFRVLGNERQDHLGPISVGHRVERIIRVAAMLDVRQLWMHIIGGIPGAVLGRLPQHLDGLESVNQRRAFFDLAGLYVDKECREQLPTIAPLKELRLATPRHYFTRILITRRRCCLGTEIP
jgi:hypothetical protein